MKLYQLCGRGSYKVFQGKGKYYSKFVFKSKNKAEEYIPTFKKKITGDRLDDLQDDDALEISILELELEE